MTDMKKTPIMGMQVAETTQAPGEGKLAAVLFAERSTHPHHHGTLEVFGAYTAPQALKVDHVTLTRFPDLKTIRNGEWEADGNFNGKVDTPEEVRLVALEEMADMNHLDDGAVAMWDAPDTLQRLQGPRFQVPPKIMDLKVLNRLMWPNFQGRRTPYSMARNLGMNLKGLPGEGVEAEALLNLLLAEEVLKRLEALGADLLGTMPANWGEMMALQSVAAQAQLSGLMDWMKSQGRSPRHLKAGWPVWEG